MEKKSAISKKLRYINIKTQNQPGSAIVANQMIKTKLCIDHQTKGCIRGDQCPYAHSVTEMRSLPDLRKTKICSLILSGKGCKNKACRYAHSDEELRSTCKFAEYRTRVCRFAKNQGGRGCLYGDRCPYAHSTEELRASSEPGLDQPETLSQDKLIDSKVLDQSIDEIHIDNPNDNKDTNAMHVIDGKRPIISTHKLKELDSQSNNNLFRKSSDSSLPKMLSKSKRATTLAKMEEQSKIPSYPQIYPKETMSFPEDEILSILSNPIPSRELAYEQLLLEKFKQNWEINSKEFYTFMQNRLYLYNLLYSKDILPTTIKQCAIEKLCKDLQAYLYKNDSILLPTRENIYADQQYNKSDNKYANTSNPAELLKQSQRY